MKIYALLFIALIIGLLCGSLLQCDNKPVNSNEELAKAYVMINQQNDVIKHFKSKITHDTIKIIEYKKAKEKIVYRTHFDTLVQVDTVIKELIKCDSVVQIDAKIITAQDSTIYDLGNVIKAYDTINVEQSKVIALKDSENKATKKELRKVKRKLFFTRVAGVFVLVGVILILL
jgi:hypothetical protein